MITAEKARKIMIDYTEDKAVISNNIATNASQEKNYYSFIHSWTKDKEDSIVRDLESLGFKVQSSLTSSCSRIIINW